MLLVLADVYRLPRLTSSCTVRSRVTRKGFPFACKSTKKTHGPGCAHAKRLFLLAGTAHASVKFKSSCTVASNGIELGRTPWKEFQFSRHIHVM